MSVIEQIPESSSMQKLLEKTIELIDAFNSESEKTNSIKNTLEFSAGTLSDMLRYKIWFFQTQEEFLNPLVVVGDSIILSDGNTMNFWKVILRDELLGTEEVIDVNTAELVAIKISNDYHSSVSVTMDSNEFSTKLKEILEDDNVGGV